MLLMSHSTGWNSAGRSQIDLMNEERCLVVDSNDNIVEFSSKGEAHKFSLLHPQGRLHRAFSVFLFNENNQLLLQQRALHKLTFPGVWSNTCCSHPIADCVPSEIDYPQAILQGDVNGIKYAARRKLEHELGIPAKEIEISSIKYLTRIHYCAATDATDGSPARTELAPFQWGEHEIDYMLLLKIPSDRLTVIPSKVSRK
jgi:isopentenyl-diphosphate delta-isomerase